MAKKNKNTKVTKVTKKSKKELANILTNKPPTDKNPQGESKKRFAEAQEALAKSNAMTASQRNKPEEDLRITITITTNANRVISGMMSGPMEALFGNIGKMNMR
jgi:hypothetical protein